MRLFVSLVLIIFSISSACVSDAETALDTDSVSLPACGYTRTDGILVQGACVPDGLIPPSALEDFGEVLEQNRHQCANDDYCVPCFRDLEEKMPTYACF